MTAFFKLFPFLASDYFYITIISFIYWLGSPKTKRLAIELICVVALSTLICILLKEHFAIARPAVKRLVVVYDPYGFPSADVAVAMVFWGMLLARNQILLLKIIAPLVVLLMAISRVYLGAHSVVDVIGGFVLGVIIILIWNSIRTQRIVDNCMMRKPIGFWIITAGIIGLCIHAALNVKVYVVLIPSYGALLALGLFLFTNIAQKFSESIHPVLAIIGFAIAIALVKFIPISQDTIQHVYISGILKYAAVTIWILFVVPQIHFCIIKRNVV